MQTVALSFFICTSSGMGTLVFVFVEIKTCLFVCLLPQLVRGISVAKCKSECLSPFIMCGRDCSSLTLVYRSRPVCQASLQFHVGSAIGMTLWLHFLGTNRVLIKRGGDTFFDELQIRPRFISFYKLRHCGLMSPTVGLFTGIQTEQLLVGYGYMKLLRVIGRW